MIIHNEVKNWIKYARFEEKNGYVNSARSIYERAVEYFGEDNMDEKLIVAFAKFEEGQREVCLSACKILRHLVLLSTRQLVRLWAGGSGFDPWLRHCKDVIKMVQDASLRSTRLQKNDMESCGMSNWEWII